MKQIYSVFIDGDNVVHQVCEIENRIQALILVRQLGAAITKIQTDLIKDIEKKGQ